MHLLLHQPEVTTPALVGYTVHDALVTLSNHNLNARILDEKEDDANY